MAIAVVVAASPSESENDEIVGIEGKDNGYGILDDTTGPNRVDESIVSPARKTPFP